MVETCGEENLKLIVLTFQPGGERRLVTCFPPLIPIVLTYPRYYLPRTG